MKALLVALFISVFTAKKSFRPLQERDPNASAATEQLVWGILRHYGLTKAGTAGVMGNLYGETQITSAILEYGVTSAWTSETYTRAVDNGTYSKSRFINDGWGYGVAGFTYWTLKEALYNKAKSRGTSIGDMTTQILLIIDTLNYGENSALKSLLKSTGDYNTAAKRFMLDWERPYDQSSSAISKRQGFAQTYYNKYASSDPKWNGTSPKTDPVTWKYAVWLQNGTKINHVAGGKVAGYAGQKIIGLAIKPSAGTVHYQVHIVGGSWLGAVTGYNWDDYNNGYAGNNKPIDAVRVTHSSVTPKYRVSPLNKGFYSYQNGDETSNGQDGYAGAFGKAIDRFELH